MKNFVFTFIFFIAFGAIIAQNTTTSPTVNDKFITISGKSEGFITPAELVGVPVLVNKEGYFVESFTLVHMLNNDLVQYSINSNVIPTDKLSIFESLLTGTTIYLENIVCRGLDGSESTIPFAKFKLLND